MSSFRTSYTIHTYINKTGGIYSDKNDKSSAPLFIKTGKGSVGGCHPIYLTEKNTIYSLSFLFPSLGGATDT